MEFLPPLAAMRVFLDALDAAGIGKDRRVPAALGPKMLELAGSGAWARTRTSRRRSTPRRPAALGADAFLAPEQKVLLETDADKSGAIARDAGTVPAAGQLATASFSKRLGFTDADIADGGSDRLVDAIVAWGDEETVAERVRAHLAAGADEVTLHVLPSREGATGQAARRVAAAGGALLG
ncbi:hypothetical protein ACU686_45055 [Yinghuangia aomiensis]